MERKESGITENAEAKTATRQKYAWNEGTTKS
jgi:hypothetical protein